MEIERRNDPRVEFEKLNIGDCFTRDFDNHKNLYLKIERVYDIKSDYTWSAVRLDKGFVCPIMVDERVIKQDVRLEYNHDY